MAREAIAEPSSVVHVSAATVWEIEIKRGLGRLVTGVDLVAALDDEGLTELPVSALHAQRAGRLPRHHGDPFDRMLVAQAQLEDLTCVTRDAAFEAYGVRTLW